MKSERPRVIANFAITADGKVSTRNFSPTGFTSSNDKKRLREIRALGDAILAGANTVANDQMSMGLSSPSFRKERKRRMQAAEPLRIIVSNRGHIDLSWKVFHSGTAPIVVFTTQRISEKKREELAPLVDLWIFEEASVDLNKVLRILRKDYGVKTLVCEGGPSLLRTMLEIGAVDELRLTWAPLIFGGTLAPGLSGLPGNFLPKSLKARLVDFEAVGDECFLHYRLL